MSEWMSEHLLEIRRQEAESKERAAALKVKTNEAEMRRLAYVSALKQAQIAADKMLADVCRLLVSKGVPKEPLIAHLEYGGLSCIKETQTTLGFGWTLFRPRAYSTGPADSDDYIEIPGQWIDDNGVLRSSKISVKQCYHPVGYGNTELERAYPRIVWDPDIAKRYSGSIRYHTSSIDISPHCSECGPGAPLMTTSSPGTPTKASDKCPTMLLARALVQGMNNLKAV